MKKYDRKGIFFGIIFTCEGETMLDSVFNTDNTIVQMIMILKMQKLKSEELPTLCYENLESFLSQSLWKEHLPATLNEAADQILHVTSNDIVQFMALKAMTDGAKENLDDFSDMLGGN